MPYFTHEKGYLLSFGINKINTFINRDVLQRELLYLGEN